MGAAAATPGLGAAGVPPAAFLLLIDTSMVGFI